MLTAFEEIPEALGKENTTKYLQRIERDLIHDAISRLNLKFGDILKSRALQATGCGLATGGLLASFFVGEEFNNLLRAILGGGAAKIGIDTARGYIDDMSKLKEDKFYFLWKLSKARKRK